MLTIAALKAKQAGRVWAVERLAHRRELARGICADVVLEPGEAIGEILRATGQRGVDCAIDCAAGDETTSQAAQITRNAGRVVLTGIPTTAIVQVDASAMRCKELTLFNVRRSNHETEEALELLGAHAAWFAPLLTHSRNIDRIDEAFQIASQYRDGVGKMTITP
jgi:L-iditol 2-dehydrogenase